MSHSDAAPIALTTGEPAGIGPELVVQLLQQPVDQSLCVLADPDLLMERAALIGLPLAIKDERLIAPGGEATLLPIELSAPSIAGELDVSNAPYVLEMLGRAADGCLSGEFSALVTAPVQKSTLIEAGNAFVGHTEFFAERAGVDMPVMMLVSEHLKVALVTIHMPLSQVPGAITTERLESVIRTVYADLKGRFGIAQPVIGVCGLNPHAGESGHLGKEEQQVISPLLKALQSEGLDVRGPLPADTAFTQESLKNLDVVVAMFHDQGLPVIKHQGFGHVVNVTLGLPFVRTSVDHGTALDLAGTGRADVSSLISAVRLAQRLCGG